MPQTVVMLSGGNGSLLELVQTPPAEPKIDERQVAVRVKVIHVPVRQIVTVPTALTVAPSLVAARPAIKPEAASVAVAVPPPPVTSAESAPAAVQPAPPVVSDANLIDLVLAAERSLRKANQ
jgi:hypothetical protein